MKTEPYRWRLSVNAAKRWSNNALIAIEERMADILNDPSHQEELVELSNTYKAVQIAAEALKTL